MTEAEALALLRAAVPANVRTVCTTLAAAGHEAVTVGGAVRDALLGRTPGDWDVATSAHPEQVMALFARCIPTGLQHGTVTIVTGRGEDSHVEVTTFRGEGAYTDARRPDHVTFGVPLDEDLARRDLRINAMAYDPASDRLHDPFAGQRDIAERMLRAVGPTRNVYDDAVARFTEDGLRVMRAVRFAAVLEFDLDPDTERGITPALPSLAKVSRERVCDELRKILGTRQPSRALRPAHHSGIIRTILPTLAPRLEGDVASRWLARVDAATPRARLPALLVELAAPGGKRIDRALQQVADQLLRDLKFSNDEVRLAAPLVGAGGVVTESTWTEPEVRQLLAELGREIAPIAVELWAADHAPIAELARTIVERGDALAAKELAIGGKDLIDALAIKPGPILGKLIAALLERVLVDPALNTRDQLLALARDLK